MRSLEEIDSDIASLRKDQLAYSRTKFHRFSPIVDDELDDLYDERRAVLKAMKDAGLKRYEVFVIPKPENKNDYCSAGYKLCAQSDEQALEGCKDAFVSGFSRYGVTAENFNSGYDISITNVEELK